MKYIKNFENIEDKIFYYEIITDSGRVIEDFEDEHMRYDREDLKSVVEYLMMLEEDFFEPVHIREFHINKLNDNILNKIKKEIKIEQTAKKYNL